jgi:hypothetical protein
VLRLLQLEAFGGTMLGIEDPGVILAFLVTLASAALCVIYGLLRWNHDDAPMPEAVHPPGEPDIDNEV